MFTVRIYTRWYYFPVVIINIYKFYFKITSPIQERIKTRPFCCCYYYVKKKIEKKKKIFFSKSLILDVRLRSEYASGTVNYCRQKLHLFSIIFCFAMAIYGCTPKLSRLIESDFRKLIISWEVHNSLLSCSFAKFFLQ